MTADEQKTRDLIELMGTLTARMISDIAADPELGPEIARAMEKHFRETIRVKALELAPFAWDLLRPEAWPPPATRDGS